MRGANRNRVDRHSRVFYRPPSGQKVFFGSLFGAMLMSINMDTLAYRIEVPAPWGECNDVAFRQWDSLVVWTSLWSGEVWLKWADGTVEPAAYVI